MNDHQTLSASLPQFRDIIAAQNLAAYLHRLDAPAFARLAAAMQAEASVQGWPVAKLLGDVVSRMEAVASDAGPWHNEPWL